MSYRFPGYLLGVSRNKNRQKNTHVGRVEHISTWRTKDAKWPSPMVEKDSCFECDFSLDAMQNESKGISDAKLPCIERTTSWKKI